ncbi:MAG: trehalose-phosphatase [Nitriliruptoraceae bacterium]
MSIPAETKNSPKFVTARALTSSIPELSTVLFALDFDGTLAPIVNNPADAALLPKAAQALNILTQHATVAVISGRPLDELAPRFADIKALTLIGEHGRVWQHPDGSVTDTTDTRLHTEQVACVYDALCALLAHTSGWTIERKPAGVAVHHRNATSGTVAKYRPAVLELLHAAGTSDTKFRVLHGHAVDELLPDTVSKGAALATLCTDHLELTPIAIGDDVTDEDAFVIALQHGGHGILVATTPRSSGASFRLAEPADVATFLTLLAARSS